MLGRLPDDFTASVKQGERGWRGRLCRAGGFGHKAGSSYRSAWTTFVIGDTQRVSRKCDPTLLTMNRKVCSLVRSGRSRSKQLKFRTKLVYSRTHLPRVASIKFISRFSLRVSTQNCGRIGQLPPARNVSPQ